LLRTFALRDATAAEYLTACGFDTDSYRNQDKTQERRGRELLDAYGAAILIPRYPLISGHKYLVSMRTSQGDFEWGFGLKPTELETAQTELVGGAPVAQSH
jgi:hypothetical protein